MKNGNGAGWTQRPRARNASPVDESRQWEEFGRWLVEQREERGLRRRDAARKAKISEAVWRDLETGRKEAIGGIRLLPNPSKEILSRVAAALDLPVEDLLTRIGRSTRSRSALSRSATTDGRDADDDGGMLWLKLKRLSDRDRRVVETVVDAFLEAEGP
jgi:transcriptional regulator with XRE-family HTH domain